MPPKAKKTTAGKLPAPHAKVVDREPTQLHKNFAAFIEEQTGYAPDLKTVQIATVLRMPFQRSEANQADLAARRKAAEERVANREANAAKRAAKKTTAKTAAPAKKTAAKKATAAPAKKTVAKKAPARRTPAKKATATETF